MSVEAPLQRQLTRVARRLFVQTMLVRLGWCWCIALVLAAGWFWAQPRWFASLAADAWLVGGVALGLGTLAAVALAVLQAPSRLTAALLLDERFGLKERVTTSLTLGAGLSGSEAAQALLADVNERVRGLDVGSRFPVRVSWLPATAPLLAAALAVAAFYYQPPPTQATSTRPEDPAAPPLNASEIEQKVARLKKKEGEKVPAAKVMSDELKRIEAELDQIASRPRDTKEELRERVKEMTALEDQIKNRQKELEEKARALQQQLRQLDKLAGKESSQSGPAKDLQKALAEGRLDDARNELDRLAKKLKNNELNNQEKEQLQKQLKDVQDKLQRLARNKEKEEKLQQLKREGKIDDETLKRELDQLKQDAKKNDDLEKLSEQIGQCQKCLQEGDGDGAVKSLEKAAEKLNELDLNEQEAQDLREQLQRLQDAKDSC